MIIHKSDERENCILVALSKDKGELSPFWVVLHKQDSILLHIIRLECMKKGAQGNNICPQKELS